VRQVLCQLNDRQQRDRRILNALVHLKLRHYLRLIRFL
jgi:hypothetical protein